jgi:hypothetical protein
MKKLDKYDQAKVEVYLQAAHNCRVADATIRELQVVVASMSDALKNPEWALIDMPPEQRIEPAKIPSSQAFMDALRAVCAARAARDEAWDNIPTELQSLFSSPRREPLPHFALAGRWCVPVRFPVRV